MQNIFSCTHCSLYIFSREMSIKIICQFLNCFSSCWVVVLYILWINNPYQIWFIGFPHFTGCVFNMSSDVPTFFYELQFFFLSCAFGVISKNHCQTQYHVAFPMFLSKSFILALMFVSLICFEFILYSVRQGSSFIILHVYIQFSQYHLLKILSLPH